MSNGLRFFDDDEGCARIAAETADRLRVGLGRYYDDDERDVIGGFLCRAMGLRNHRRDEVSVQRFAFMCAALAVLLDRDAEEDRTLWRLMEALTFAEGWEWDEPDDGEDTDAPDADEDGEGADDDE